MRIKLFLTLAVFTIFSMTALFAQDGGAKNSESKQKSNDIITVEEAYLHSIEGVIIKEMVQSEGRDAKLVALQYIENAVEGGRGDSEEIQAALDSLATIGLSTVVREGGRVINNYPDIRVKACALLAKIPTEKSKDTLMKVMYADNEPLVITTAIRSLGEIGINNNDETIEMINWINRKFSIINPTSSLAFEVLNTYEKLAPNVKNKKDMIEAIMGIAGNYNYVTPVRNRALEVLKTISNEGK
ncbi:HEAT repeat domain-containing protein [Treponema phagedenis]|uniref:HEAT repeat domain-containing protein n=1 Tax=Treponema phagedenis TaxID=162 RepID=UPI0001F641AF|nr:hypothetical protein HMPREF9554_00036 [Treponema phagedenis F0421]TYT76366.1 HEAT repeat domain-containing protein [Treponema phagedenis]TYT76617.1 HEAT repeat domain-containing protein [Treponema phagedenis]